MPAGASGGRVALLGSPITLPFINPVYKVLCGRNRGRNINYFARILEHVAYTLQVYSKEICELIKVTLGAACVWEAMEPTVRNKAKSRGFPQSHNGLDPMQMSVRPLHPEIPGEEASHSPLQNVQPSRARTTQPCAL